MKKIYLSNTDKKLAGVCGGLAEAFDIDSTLVRLAVVFIALVTAVIPALITYIIAAIIIPQKPTTGSASGSGKVYEATPEGESK
jgi:phage shock protein PspC (stress-responsive transcriptional regulator)